MPRIEHHPPSAHRDASPPPIRSRRWRTGLVIACGVIVSLVLLFVVLQVESPPQHAQNNNPIPGAQELIAPTDLRPEDLSGGGFDPQRSIDVALPQGMTIEVQEGDRLAQRYRCAHSDPRPGGWIHMDKPEVELFLSDDRLLVMTGDSALVHIPQRALVSGTLTGNVVIRLFELTDFGEVDIDADDPALRVMTGEARFDNFLGEIQCDGEVDIQTPELYLLGELLRLKINDQLRRPERLEIERTQFVRIASLPQDSVDGEHAAPTEPKESRAKEPKDPAATRPDKRDRPKRQNRTAAELPFYLLTLNENVLIRQGDDATGWTANGDELRLIFSFKSGGFERTVARSNSDSNLAQTASTGKLSRAPGAVMSLPAAISSTVLTATANDLTPMLYQSSPDEITITFDGKFTMVPLADRLRQPKSEEDSHLELVGGPVQLVSHADQAQVQCATLQYQTLSRMLRLLGEENTPLVMSSPEFRAGGGEFWLDQTTNKAGFDREGWLELETTDATAQPPAEDSQPVRITWTDRMRLNFNRAPGSSGSADGAVETKPGGLTDSTIRSSLLNSVVFRGNVAVTSAQGRMNADNLRVDLKQTKQGKTIPTRVAASGNVMAAEEGQFIWANEIIANLRETTGHRAVPESGSLAQRGRDVELETLSATGGVQIRLPDGTRAFADTLDANAIDGTLVLESADLLIASDTMLIDQGSRLKLNRDAKTALWPGPGRARVFRDAVMENSEQPVERPVIDAAANPVQVLATWATDMSFDSTVNDGAGALILRGDVKGDSTPSVLERSTLQASELTLEFAHAPESDATTQFSSAEDSHDTSSATQDDLLTRGSRQLMRLIARDDARLESRTWMREDHSDTPRVFYLAGQMIDYNNITLEASVPGAGELLVRDERPEAEITDEQPAEASPARAPFAARGTSLFKWTQGLDMVRSEGDLFTITMAGDVDAIHREPAGRETVFKGQLLQASALRTQTDRPTENAVDLGGSMELKRLRGSGAVFVRSPERDITCDEFDYDLLTGMARLAARQGSNVMVITRGSPHPMRAEEMVWDMNTDTISITRGAGTVPR